MNLTVLELLKAALRPCGVLRKGEELPNDEAQDALQAANFLLNEWSTSPLMVLGTVMQSFPITSASGAYTIGVGANFNTSKPTEITDAFVRDASGVDFGVDVVGLDLWNSYQDKSLATGRPVALFYDPGATQQATDTGTVNLYPLPDAAYTLFLGGQKPLTEFAALADTVTLQTAYHGMVKWSLCEDMWPEYHENEGPPLWIAQRAKVSRDVVRRMNHKPLHLAQDLPKTGTGGRSGFNILSGQFG